MKIISNYLGRGQRESWREEKNGKVNAKQEMGNESKGKGSERKREIECAPPCEQWQCCQSVTMSAEGEGGRREISWTREKVEAKTQPVYESVFFRS